MSSHYFNVETLTEYFGDNQSAIADFLSLFIHRSMKNQEQMEEALETSKFDEINVLAHNNCSALKYLGIMNLAELFYDIELATEVTPIKEESLLPSIQNTRKELSLLIDEIKLYLKENTNGKQ